MLAIVMAGGEGTRLRPLTCRLPKPMVPLLGKPVMEYTVEQLEKHGFTDITATLMYRPEEVQAYFGDRIGYFIEEEPLGTAGGVKRAAGDVGETVLVVSGDALTDIDYTRALEFHKKSGAVATLVLTRVENPQEFGVVVISPEGRVERFLEKPKTGDVLTDVINTGIYFLEPEALERIPEGRYDFGKDLFPALVSEGLPVYGYVSEGYWCDIGDVDAYIASHSDVLDGLVSHIAPPENGVFIHPSARVDDGAEIFAPCHIAQGAVVRSGARVGPYSVIGRGAAVLEEASAVRSILWEGATLDPGAEARGALLLSGAQLGRGAQAYEGAVVGERTGVGERAVLLPGALIWPHKQVEAGMRIKGSLVWGGGKNSLLRGRGARGGRSVFGAEDCVALGAAMYAAVGDSCAVIDNGEGGARAAADAFCSGFAGAGGRVYRLGVGTPQSLIFALRSLDLLGGCAVRVEDGALAMDLYSARGTELTDGQMRSCRQAFLRRDSAPVALERVRPPVEVRGVYKQRCVEFARLMGVKEHTGISLNVSSRDSAVLREVRCMLEEYVSLTGEKKGVICATIAGDGEGYAVIDEGGRQVARNKMAGLFALVSATFFPDEDFYAPADASGIIDVCAKAAGVGVRRANASRHDMLEMLSGEKPSLALWRSVYFDAAAALLALCAYLYNCGKSLSAVVDSLDETHMRSLTYPLREGEKAAAMRRLVEATRDMRATLGAGVRLEHELGWAVVSPSDDAPEFRVVCESFSNEAADELAGFCIDLLKGRKP